jgi:hypothetical protein
MFSGFKAEGIGQSGTASPANPGLAGSAFFLLKLRVCTENTSHKGAKEALPPRKMVVFLIRYEPIIII